MEMLVEEGDRLGSSSTPSSRSTLRQLVRVRYLREVEWTLNRERKMSIGLPRIYQEKRTPPSIYDISMQRSQEWLQMAGLR